jgi:hypothetical protein
LVGRELLLIQSLLLLLESLNLILQGYLMAQISSDMQESISG